MLVRQEHALEAYDVRMLQVRMIARFPLCQAGDAVASLHELDGHLQPSADAFDKVRWPVKLHMLPWQSQ